MILYTFDESDGNEFAQRTIVYKIDIKFLSVIIIKGIGIAQFLPNLRRKTASKANNPNPNCICTYIWE